MVISPLCTNIALIFMVNRMGFSNLDIVLYVTVRWGIEIELLLKFPIKS